MNAASPLKGQRVLVVEDDFLLAQDIRSMLHEAGAHVLGPVPTPEAAIGKIEDEGPIDFSVLDVNLGGARGFTVADVLIERRMPFALTTGYDVSGIPERYAAAPCCQKPVSIYDLERAFEQSVGRRSSDDAPG